MGYREQSHCFLVPNFRDSHSRVILAPFQPFIVINEPFPEWDVKGRKIEENSKYAFVSKCLMISI
jgi:hypothetical protein